MGRVLQKYLFLIEFRTYENKELENMFVPRFKSTDNGYEINNEEKTNK